MYDAIDIGGVRLEDPFILAPLAGVTDAAMREICERFGAAMTTTEMVSAKGLCYGDRKTSELLYIDERTTSPVAVQIFGSEPDIMGEAVRILDGRATGMRKTPLGACRHSIIDVNMGCPVPKVVKNGDGAALLKSPDKVYDVLSAVKAATDKPVTVKIREGFDDDCINAVEVAKAAEAAGVSAICVHGRTREQFYSGKADWDIIAEVKKNVGIKVIGNGDVFKAEDGIAMMKETGCDAVMVARGALGNPFIFRDLRALYRYGERPEPPTPEERSRVMLEHFDRLIELKGEYRAVREMRKHAGWYTKGMPGAAALRGRINAIDSIEEMKEVLTFA